MPIETIEENIHREVEQLIREQVNDILMFIKNTEKLIYDLKILCDPYRLEVAILEERKLTPITASDLFPEVLKEEDRKTAHVMGAQLLRDAIVGMAKGAKPVIERHIEYLNNQLLQAIKSMYYLYVLNPKTRDELTEANKRGNEECSKI
jgi:radical SAM superfamily enzyme YgiQ (UPF0313 family)